MSLITFRYRVVLLIALNWPPRSSLSIFQFLMSIGPDGRSLIQPFAVAVLSPGSNPDADQGASKVSVLLLDTGNSRLLVVDAETGDVKSVLAGNDALKGQAATGMTLCPQGLWIVNWRANELALLDLRTNEVSIPLLLKIY